MGKRAAKHRPIKVIRGDFTPLLFQFPRLRDFTLEPGVRLNATIDSLRLPCWWQARQAIGVSAFRRSEISKSYGGFSNMHEKDSTGQWAKILPAF